MINGKTSGRLSLLSVPATVVPPYSRDSASTHYSQCVEIDSLVRLEMERLQSGMEILRRKHCRELLSMVEQKAAKRLRMKEVELENVCQRNTELEEQVRQMSSESQVWFNYAKTTDAVASDLKVKLDQVLANPNTCPSIEAGEGYGDSGGDEESVCEGSETRRMCRVCKTRKVCVLLLPCRHFCLCKGCEARIDTCPVCDSTRNASIQVVIP